MVVSSKQIKNESISFVFFSCKATSGRVVKIRDITYYTARPHIHVCFYVKWTTISEKINCHCHNNHNFWRRVSPLLVFLSLQWCVEFAMELIQRKQYQMLLEVRMLRRGTGLGRYSFWKTIALLVQE